MKKIKILKRQKKSIVTTNEIKPAEFDPKSLRKKTKKVKAPENQDVVNSGDLDTISLIQKATAMREKKEIECAALEEMNREKIVKLAAQEKALKAEIETAQKHIERIEGEYDELEKKRSEENLSEIRRKEKTRADVQNGRVSVGEYFMQGKQDEEIKVMTQAKTLEDLEQVSDAIRAKKAEVIDKEFELYSIQRSIFHMTFYPARILRETYKIMGEFLDDNIAPLAAEWHSVKYLMGQKEHEQLLIKTGCGISGGHRWDNISVQQARRLVLDPILPKGLIPDLIRQLDQDEVDEQFPVNVVFNHRQHPLGESVQVQQF